MSDATEINGCWQGILAANRENSQRDAARLRACVDVFAANESRNEQLQHIYEGSVPLRVLPDTVPARYRSMTIGCPWPEVAVQSVVERSQFDGFVFTDPDCDAARRLDAIAQRCDLDNGYQVALTDSLITGVSFAVVCRDDEGASVRWHTAHSAAGTWNYAKQRLDCGFAIVDRMRRPGGSTGDERTDTVPSQIDFYTEAGCWELTRSERGGWSAEWLPDGMGRPRIEALVFRPDGTHPLGRSRISRPMRAIVQEYMANALNIHVASEFTAIGQKWATGLSDTQLAKFAENKWNFSADSAVLVTDNPATGSNPQFGTFTQQSMEPLLSVKRSLATDFAAAASLPISELLTQDSNPTSAEALNAAKDKLISLVECVNRRNRRTLRTLGMMLLAIDGNKALADLTEEERGAMAHFREPSTPTAASLADANLKIAQTIDGYGNTTVCRERLGFDASERARIQAETDSLAATEALNELAAIRLAKEEAATDGN